MPYPNMNVFGRNEEEKCSSLNTEKHSTLKSETVSSADEEDYQHQSELTIYKTWEDYSTRLKDDSNIYKGQYFPFARTENR